MILLPTDGTWYQFSAHRNPEWHRRTLYSGKTAHLLYSRTVKAAQLGGSPGNGGPGARPLLGETVLLCSSKVCFVLLWPDICVSAQPRRPSLHCSLERESVLSEPEGSWLLWTEVFAPVPNWYTFMPIGTPNLCLIGSKGTVLIGRNRTTLLNQGWAALIGWRKPQFYWLK